MRIAAALMAGTMAAAAQTAPATPATPAPPVIRCAEDGEGGACVWGRAEGYDAGSVRVRGLDVTLLGISAPSRRDLCHSKAGGRTFDCAQPARKRVGELVAKGIACEIMDVAGGTLAGRCRVADGDLAALLVRDGLVLARSGPYEEAGRKAMMAGRGLWAADLILPKELDTARAKVDREKKE